MAVVLKILFGILILLLALLGLVLVLFLLLLFCPFSYQVKGRKNAEGLMVNAKVKWLLGFVRVCFDYPTPKTPIVKIACFTLFGKKKVKKDHANVSPQSETEERYKPNNSEESVDQPTDDSEVNASAQIEEAASGKPEASDAEPAESPDEAFDSRKETKKKEKAKKESKKESKKKDKIPLTERISNLKDDLAFYKELWEDGNTKPLLKAVLKRAFHVLRNLLPRKVHGKLIFGAATPDVTGYAYGGYVVLKAIYPKKFFLELTPDFEKQILEGEFLIKGHFTVFIIVLDGLRILFDKRLKILRQKLKARKAETGGDSGQQTLPEEKEKRSNKKKHKF